MTLHLHALRVERDAFVLEADATFGSACTAVLGASGSGKTTLLECVAGLLRPAVGSIRLDGEIVSDAATQAFVPAWRRRVGLVPQEGALFPHLSVRANLRYGARAETGEFDRIVEVLGIGDLLERRVPSLSGGEKRRVALGRALLAHPRILLLDEPLTGLDRPLKERAIALLRRIRDELRVPMLLVTHDDWEAAQLAESFVRLDGGRVIERGALAG